MSVKENILISNRNLEAMGAGDFDTLKELISPSRDEDFVNTSSEVRAAFPDYHSSNSNTIAKGETQEGFKYLYGRKLLYTRDVMSKCATVLEQNHFNEIITPSVLGYELVVGLFNRPVSLADSDIVFNFVTRDGEHLALTYENTLPVCKFYIDHFSHKPSSFKKFYYISSHFRNERVINNSTRFRQFYQVGWELLGGTKGSYISDAITMGDKILHTLGMDHVIKVSDVNILGEIFKIMPFTQEEKRELLQLLDNRNAMGLKRFLKKVPASDSQKELLLLLLKNTENVNTYLSSLSNLLLINGISETIPRVQKVCEIVRKLQKTCKHVVLDFSLVRSNRFYSGIIFQYYTDHSSHECGGGGEYDSIVKSLGGPDTKACGGAFGLERLIHECRRIQTN